MNVLEAAISLNRRAMREHWHYVCDPSLAFSESSYDKLLQLWRGKSAGRPMPRRSEMTLRDLKDVLRHLIVLERVETRPSRYRVRLLGTSLTSMAGDRTGEMLEEILPAEHAMRWSVTADLILDSSQPMRFIGRVELQGKEYLNAENLFMPLANENDEPTFVMGFCRYTPRHSESEETWESQIASMPGVA